VTVDDPEWLAERFEAQRARLRAVAYRMLGSASDADDAVQQSWLHVSRAGTSEVENLGGWLTTVVARVCLDMLRSRKAKREEPLEAGADDGPAGRVALTNPEWVAVTDPEQEALLADSVGVALLVVLDTLTPAERLAFVLHDLFDMPFDEIAPIVDRSPTAARQLASRARRRVRGATPAGDADLARQRHVVDAFLAASRRGDFDALLAILDPDVVARADGAATPAGAPIEVRGARGVAEQALLFSRRTRYAQPALVNGAVGIVVAPRGRLMIVMTLAVRGTRITEIEIVAERARLAGLELAVLPKTR
jgi:RNA polymerase sigma factor (sigma-70 family)